MAPITLGEVMEPKSPSQGMGLLWCMKWGVSRALELLLVLTWEPLAIRGKEAHGEGIPTAPLSPCSASSQELRAGEQERGERVGVDVTQRSIGY